MPGIWGAAAPQSQPSDAANNDDLHHDDEMVDDNQDVDVMDLDGNGGDYEYYNQLEDEDGGDRNEYEDVGGDGNGWGEEEEEPSEANTDLENQNETNASGAGQVAVAPGKDHGEGGEAERGARETTSLPMASGMAGAASLEGDFTNPNDGENESSENNSVSTLAQARDATTATVFAEASNQRCGLDVLSTAAAKATNGASDSVAASTNKQLLKANHPSVVDAPSASNQGEQRAREGSLDGAAMEPSTLSGTNNGPTTNASESTSMEVRPHQGGVATGMIMLSHSSASADQRIVPGMTIPEDKNAAAGVAHKPPNNEASQAPDNSHTGVTVPEAPIHNSPKMLEARPMGTSNGNQQAHQVRHQVSEKTKESSLGASQNTMFRPGHSFSKGQVSRKSPGSQRSAPAMEGVTRMTGNGSRASTPNNRSLANNDGQRRPPMLTARPSQPALARTTGPSVTRERLFEASAATVNNPSGGMRASRGNPRYNQASNATATMGSNVKSNSNKAGESGHNASNGGLRVNQRSTTLGYSNTVRNPQSLRQHQDVSRGSRSMNAFSHQTNMTDAVSTTAPSHQQKQPPLRSRENLIAPETPPAHPSILRGGESGQFKVCLFCFFSLF